MIDFVIVEDNSYFNNVYQKIIDEVADILRISINKYAFFDYDNNFKRTIKQNLHNSIYILDIETPSCNGLDVAREIRKYDKQGLIIFITSYYEEYTSPILKSMIGYLRYINKSDDYQKELEETLLIAINEIDFEHFISIETLNTNYYIDIEDILYIYTYNRVTYIVTNQNEIPCGSRTIKSFIDKLPFYFTISHRSCIVNLKKIKYVDKKELIIYLKNDMSIELLSKVHIKDITQKLNIMSKNSYNINGDYNE